MRRPAALVCVALLVTTTRLDQFRPLPPVPRAPAAARRDLAGVRIHAMGAPARITTTNPRAPADDDLRLYCRLTRLAPSLPAGGDLEVASWTYDRDDDGVAGEIMLLRSGGCPGGGYSVLRVDAFDRVREEMRCTTESPIAIRLRTMVQGNVVDDAPRDRHASLALSGPGFFVLRCDDGLYLSRLGEFDHAARGALMSGGCVVQDTRGADFNWRGSVDDRGCGPDGACVAVVDADPARVRVATPRSYRALDDPHRRPIPRPHVIPDAHEDPDDAFEAERTRWRKLPPGIDARSCATADRQ